VIARASDGVVAVFPCAELMPQMGRTRAFVAWAVDGGALPADEGPLRIVVSSDIKGSRSLRQVVELRVVDARKVEAR
jgi:DMSO/TMAO reductase YedYZ molybdopterin-dependent catalytic subunit